jgi:O-antigen/teichoic acid export membrane protein
MSSRTNRVTILAISKLLNFAVQFLTPILLVRIIDRELYGQYKEFFVYASLLGTFISFSIKYNLLYFISKNPKGIKHYVSNTIFLELVICVLGVIIIYIFQSSIISASSFNFFFLLVIYLIITRNFDFLEPFWLSQKKSNYVFYYSFIFAVIRVISIVVIAYLTRDLILILYMVIALEFLRLLFSIAYSIFKKLIVLQVNYAFLKEQLVYIVPLGLAGLLVDFNADISKFVISTNLGPSALALYAIGSQRVPLIGIIQTSIADVIFPDMAEKVKDEPLQALGLWKRANILYLFLLVPLFYLQLYYAEIIIQILFTQNYLGSVPIFQIYLGFFLLQCFEMGIPIRVKNKNKSLLIGHIFYTIIHIGILYLFYNFFGFLGPAIAFVFMEILFIIYFGSIILRIYEIKIKELFHWRKVFIIISAGLICTPILYIGDLLKLDAVLSLFLFSAIYTIVYLIIVSFFHFEETDLFIARVLRKFKLEWKWKRSA